MIVAVALTHSLVAPSYATDKVAFDCSGWKVSADHPNEHNKLQHQQFVIDLDRKVVTDHLGQEVPITEFTETYIAFKGTDAGNVQLRGAIDLRSGDMIVTEFSSANTGGHLLGEKHYECTRTEPPF